MLAYLLLVASQRPYDIHRSKSGIATWPNGHSTVSLEVAATEVGVSKVL